MPLALLVIGIGTFVLVGIAGLSVIDRYLLVPSLMVMIFAAVALGGWTMLRAGARADGVDARRRALVVVYGVVFTATRVNLTPFEAELQFRDARRTRRWRRCSTTRRCAQAMRCGPISVAQPQAHPRHPLARDLRGRARCSRAATRRPPSG